jgi:Flp pilus assembly protein protease CpaA
LAKTIWIFAAAFALTAGFTDFRYRKIPNWLTYPAIPIAILLHWIIAGRHAALLSLGGAAVGLGILLPFVLLGGLGGGDWKLVGALGAFFEPRRLIPVLTVTLMISGLMALASLLWKQRVRQASRNSGSEKVPFGIAAAIATLLYVAAQPWLAF